MLCGANQSPFSDPDWLFQLKWDGYRALLLNGIDNFEILSRSGKDMSVQFPEIVRDLRQLPPGTAIDGEVVVRDENGFPVGMS
jgi:bifunctional non-homologous end joining protein LigD